ncbi:MAG: hypothetical protein ACREYE_09620 [Gammaproteobacteria bacterium]
MKKSAALGISCSGCARRLETGDWRLETGDWRLDSSNLQPQSSLPALRRNATSLRSRRFFHKL